MSVDPVRAGLEGNCPRCGEGKLFAGLLTFNDGCRACGLTYEFNDTGDGPTVFIIMGLGFVVLGAALFVELNYAPSVLVHVLAWPVMIVALGLPALRLTKGWLAGLAYKHRRTDS